MVLNSKETKFLLCKVLSYASMFTSCLLKKKENALIECILWLIKDIIIIILLSHQQ